MLQFVSKIWKEIVKKLKLRRVNRFLWYINKRRKNLFLLMLERVCYDEKIIIICQVMFMLIILMFTKTYIQPFVMSSFFLLCRAKIQFKKHKLLLLLQTSKFGGNLLLQPDYHNYSWSYPHIHRRIKVTIFNQTKLLAKNYHFYSKIIVIQKD